jgi:aminopeptidase-like protein
MREIKPELVCRQSSPIVEDILSALANRNRNIVSDEFEQSLDYLKKYIDLKVHKYETGMECWTWNIPPKWRIKDAYIKNRDTIIVSFKDCPLHVMSYSMPIKQIMKGEDLLRHVYVHNKLPDAIPYKTTYYKPDWGFCLMHEQRDKIKSNEVYEVVIDSEFIDDYLSVGEYTVKGKSDEHIFFLSHLDHPLQVNDGLIGCAVNTALAKLLEGQDLYYNYTFLFTPESIGSIAFLSQNEALIPKIRYAIYIEMVGLNNPFILQRSYRGTELINEYAQYIISKFQGETESYPYLSVIGNDEKVFNAPGVDVPGISITRVDSAKIWKAQVNNHGKDIVSVYDLYYPEYHTHMDDINTVSFEKVNETIRLLYDMCQLFEADYIPLRKFKGPVFFSKYDLWTDGHVKKIDNIMQLMYFLEGNLTVFQIAKELHMDFYELLDILEKFYNNGLIEKKRIPIGFDKKG